MFGREKTRPDQDRNRSGESFFFFFSLTGILFGKLYVSVRYVSVRYVAMYQKKRHNRPGGRNGAHSVQKKRSLAMNEMIVFALTLGFKLCRFDTHPRPSEAINKAFNCST